MRQHNIHFIRARLLKTLLRNLIYILPALLFFVSDVGMRNGVGFVVSAHATHFSNSGPIITTPTPPGPPGPPPPPPCPDCPPDPDEKQEPGPSPTTENTPPPNAEDCKIGSEGGEGRTGESGGPVSLYSGYESFIRTDLTVKGLYDIQLSRKYNSQSTYDSPLGYGWSLNYDQRLFEYSYQSTQSVVIRYGCGRKDRFIYSAGAYQTPVDGMKGTLEALPAGEYVYTHLSGMKDFYDAEGRFTARQNQRGERLEFSYDLRGKLPLTGASPFAIDPSVPMLVARHYRLTKIEERDAAGNITGNFIDLFYDDNTGRLRTATANDGRQITYLQDVTVDTKTLGNLITVNGLVGHVSTYIYDDKNGSNVLQDIHNITTIQEGSEAPFVNEYDAEDRVKKQTHAGSIRNINYVVPNLETKVTTTILEATGYGSYLFIDNVESYYWFDPITEKVSAYEDGKGNRYEYDYDAFQNLDVTRIFLNEGTKAAPILTPAKDIDYSFDSEGNKLAEAVTLASSEVITKSWTYDNGWIASEQVFSSFAPTKIFRTEYTFNKVDGVPINVKEMKRRIDGSTFQTTSFFYDTQDRLITVQFQDGHRMHYLYEGVDHPFVTKIYHEIGNTGTESPFDSVRFDYDTRGNVSDIWDANSNHTQREYDDIDRITKIINTLNEETIFTYANDRLQTVEIGKTVGGGEGQVLKLNYNFEKRVDRIDAKNDSGGFVRLVSYMYDSEGHLLSENDGEFNLTTYEYDEVGNLSKVIDPKLNETLYTFDATGRAVSIIDGNINETKFTFDALQRCIKAEKVGANNITVQFTYDANNNRTSFVDGEGHTTTFNYDSLSRLTSEVQELGQTLQYFYDDRNRLDYKLNGRGQKIDFNYYEWGAVQSVQYFADDMTAVVDRAISYTYNNTGTLNNISDTAIAAGQLYSFTYDVLNRRDITTISAYPGAVRTLDYDYDRFGNRNGLTLTDASGTHIHQYTYDKLNNLISASLPGGQSFNNIAYYNNNMLKQLATPSGLITDYLYESNGPVQDIKTTNLAAIVEQFTYTYDNNNNVDTITNTNTVTALFHDYNYDNINRLTQATHPSGLGIPTAETYVYDGAGNREDPSDLLLYDYDLNNRILLSPGVASYAYDSDGNMLTKGTEAFTYNHDSRISAYTNGSDNASYKYDSFGRRVSKTVNGITTWYLWDETKLLAEYDNLGIQTKRYAYLGNAVYPVQLQDGNGIYDVHNDHLGAPRFLTDTSKSVVWSAYYASFGVSSVNNNVDGDTNLIEFNIRFPGQYYDLESGLHYNYFRDYDPATGRYIQGDPLRLNGLKLVLGNNFTMGDMNLYAYALNNPLFYIDPLGLVEAPINPKFEFENVTQNQDKNGFNISTFSADGRGNISSGSQTFQVICADCANSRSMTVGFSATSTSSGITKTNIGKQKSIFESQNNAADLCED